MLFQGQVQSSVPTARQTGNPNALQIQLGELGVSEIQPRYGALAWSGQLFYAANTAQQALSVASATYTGLAVANPSGSGKNLVFIDAMFAMGTLPAGLSSLVLGTAATVALTTGSSTGPTGLNCLIGSGANSVAKVGASATLGAAPSITRAIAGVQWVTTGTTTNIQIVKDEIAGVIIVPPGQLLCIEAITTAQTGIASFTWAELPI